MRFWVIICAYGLQPGRRVPAERDDGRRLLLFIIYVNIIYYLLLLLWTVDDNNYGKELIGQKTRLLSTTTGRLPAVVKIRWRAWDGVEGHNNRENKNDGLVDVCRQKSGLSRPSVPVHKNSARAGVGRHNDVRTVIVQKRAKPFLSSPAGGGRRRRAAAGGEQVLGKPGAACGSVGGGVFRRRVAATARARRYRSRQDRPVSPTVRVVYRAPGAVGHSGRMSPCRIGPTDRGHCACALPV